MDVMGASGLSSATSSQFFFPSPYSSMLSCLANWVPPSGCWSPKAQSSRKCIPLDVALCHGTMVGTNPSYLISQVHLCGLQSFPEARSQFLSTDAALCGTPAGHPLFPAPHFRLHGHLQVCL